MWARHLKDLLVPLRNSEFDVLVTLKDSATVLQIEVKTYPQELENVNKESLRKAVDAAQFQLEKGREMFSSIIFPLADMSSTWSHRGLICLPNIENRGDLRHHGIT